MTPQTGVYAGDFVQASPVCHWPQPCARRYGAVSLLRSLTGYEGPYRRTTRNNNCMKTTTAARPHRADDPVEANCRRRCSSRMHFLSERITGTHSRP